MRIRRPYLGALLGGAAVLAVVVIAVILHDRRERQSLLLPGMVRQTEIRIAPEVSGRLKSVAVSPGQHVKRGDLLAIVDNPDLVAALGQARAALASAKADRDHVFAGVRQEQIAIAGEAVHMAEAQLTFAQQQNERATALAARSFASQANLDESTASVAKAVADLDQKRAQLAAAKTGPTAEQRALAEAKVRLAAAAARTVQLRLDKTRLVAPVDGTVRLRIAEDGEVLMPGKPVLTLQPDDQDWFAFTLREDALRGLRIGGKVSVRTATGGSVDAVVSELRPLGEFATWRAARAVGDHDLNSFRLRLDPLKPDPKRHAGMMVWIDRSR